MNSVTVANKQFDSDSVSTLDSSSWSWFEPLENIISSASSSSIGSPIGEPIGATAAGAASGAMEPLGGDIIAGTSGIANPGAEVNANSNMFGDVFTDPSSYSNSPTNEFMPIEVKKEQQQDDFNLSSLGEADKLSQAQAQTLKKKRAPRKRLTSHQKQAHNKIEKRYRININTKIAKLQKIIPWVASEQTAFEVGDSIKRPKDELSADPSASSMTAESQAQICAASSTKLNKSMILEKAVDYILYLQNSERLYEMEVQRLKNEVETLKKN